MFSVPHSKKLIGARIHCLHRDTSGLALASAWVLHHAELLLFLVFGIIPLCASADAGGGNKILIVSRYCILWR